MLEGMGIDAPSGYTYIRPDNHQGYKDAVIGMTKNDPKYEFPVWDPATIITIPIRDITAPPNWPKPGQGAQRVDGGRELAEDHLAHLSPTRDRQAVVLCRMAASIGAGRKFPTMGRGDDKAAGHRTEARRVASCAACARAGVRERAAGIVLAAALVSAGGHGGAGHSVGHFPSYYPDEIRIDVVDSATAAKGLANQTLHAYVGATPAFCGAAAKACEVRDGARLFSCRQRQWCRSTLCDRTRAAARPPAACSRRFGRRRRSASSSTPIPLRPITAMSSITSIGLRRRRTRPAPGRFLLAAMPVGARGEPR